MYSKAVSFVIIHGVCMKRHQGLDNDEKNDANQIDLQLPPKYDVNVG